VKAILPRKYKNRWPSWLGSDGKIGLAEVIYILQKVAGTR
jgi:hypothetical protein